MRFFPVFYLAFCLAPNALGSTWVVSRAADGTDLKILNRGADAASVQVQLIPSIGANSLAPQPVTESVGPGQTLVLPQVLQALWGLSGIVGGIEVTSDHVLLVTARTSNNGAYGYVETAAATTDLPDGGQERHAVWISQSADPTKGFSSIAGALLLTPDATVNMTLYDGANNMIATTQFTGGPGSKEIAVRTLVSSDLPIGRVEFDVVSGMAAPYALVTDNVTGDPMSVPAAPYSTSATNLFFTNLVKATAGQAQTWRSDLRLLSSYPSAEIAVQATIVSSSVAALAGSTQMIDLFPGQIMEIQDVLGSVFNAPDGATATVQFTSPFGVLMFARTAYVYNDGTPGSFGYLHVGNATGSFLTHGQTASLIGLRQDSTAPGAVTTIGAASGQDGFMADLVLSDASGNQLATIPSGLVLLPATTSEVAIGTLFPNVPIPDDAHVDILPDSGEALVYAKNTNLASNDVDQMPANVLTPYYCPAPSVIVFSASPATLTAPGMVQLNWNTSGGGSVAIDQGAGGGGEFGSARVSLRQSTTFNLTAQNSCGTTTAALNVPVGAPAISGIVPSSATPGQTVTLSINNAGNVSSERGAFLACGTPTTQYVPLDIDSSGNVTFVVPFVQDSNFPGGYWQGSCTLSAQADSGQSAPSSFTIAPFTFTGDPAAAFQTAVANLQQQSHAQFATPTGIAAFDQAATVLDPMIDQWAAILNQMASDVKANGTATMPLGIATRSAPAPPTITVTMADLTHVVALLNANSPDLLTPQSSRLGAKRLNPRLSLPAYHDDGSASCLIRDPQIGQVYAQCVNELNGVYLGTGIGSVEGMGRSAINSNCDLDTTLAAIAVRLLDLALSPEFSCNVAPVTFSSFSAVPPSLPVGSLEQTNNGGTKISVTLAKNWGQGGGSDPVPDFLDSFRSGLEAMAAQNRCGSDTTGKINTLFGQLEDTLNSEVGTALQNVSAKYPGHVTSTVYKCDLAVVTPQDTSALNHRTDREDQTKPPYYFEGRKPGGTSLIVVPYPGNFITASPGLLLTNYDTVEPPGNGKVYVPLTVNGGPSLSIGAQLAATYDPTGAIPVATSFNPPIPVGGPVCISPASAEGVPPVSCGSGGPPSAFVTIDPQGEKTWKVTVQVSGAYPLDGLAQIDLLAFNPPQFGPTSHIQVTGTLSLQNPGCAGEPTCAFPDGIMMVDDPNAKGGMQTVSLYPPDMAPNPNITVDSSKGTIGIYAGLMVNGITPNGPPSPPFSVTFTIQFMNQ